MSLLSRLFRPRGDDHAEVRPLWHAVVAEARQPGWFAQGRVADTVSGRFDTITLVLALVLLRMERDPVLAPRTARLTELFISDMDGQLRELGVGDPVMGKRMGQLVGAFGGRLGAYRDALGADHAALREAIERNVTFAESGDADFVASQTRALVDRLAARDSAALLAGRIAA